MNGPEVLDLLDKIAATASKNEKQALVEGGMLFPLFQRVCKYAYNPFMVYGIATLPIGKAHVGFRTFNGETWKILDDLIQRRLTGTAAFNAITAEIDQLDEKSAELFRRIIRKDLRAGFSESTINKACKGLIPDFPYMRCSLPKDAKLETWAWEEGAISQEKADGMFANVDHYEDGGVALRSRQGSEFPVEQFGGIVSEIATHFKKGYQYHGEIVVLRDGKILDREIGNGIMNSVLKGGSFGENERPKFFVWDAIPLKNVTTKGKYDLPYRMRLAQLASSLRFANCVSVALIPTKVVRSLAEGYAHAAELMKQGKEGTIIKNPNMTWKDGTSKDQVKLKLEFEVDLEIEGIVPGRVGTKNEGRAGSLACKSSDGLLRVDVTVKNEKLRDLVDANPDDYIGRVIAVVANDIMEPSESNDLHSLFLPRMAEDTYRTDKTVADSLQRIIDTKQAAIFGEKIMKEAA